MLKGKLCFVSGLALLGAAVCSGDEYKKEETRPVFLKSMSEKPWFDKSYPTRIPILVSEPVGMDRKNAVIDFELPPGDAPGDVKIVSEDGDEIPSQIIRPDGKTEIVFLTDLRKYERKPFFIYLAKAGSGKTAVPPGRPGDLRLDETDKFLIIGNDKIEVEIWRETDRKGKINRLHIKGSDNGNELSELSVGGGWFGHAADSAGRRFFELQPGVSTAKLTVSGPLKKVVEFAGGEHTLRYSFYSFSGRIDYEIIPGTAKSVGTRTAWLVNGAAALDKIYYESEKGVKTLSGERNEILDSNDFYPRYNLREWLKEGWLALEDASGETTAGEFFDIKSLKKCEVFSQGINAGENIILDFSLEKPVRGALAALRGNFKKFRERYIEWKNPPEVHICGPQAFQDIKIKVPDFTKDVTRTYKTEILHIRDANRNDSSSAAGLVKTVKSLGANAIKLDIKLRYVFPLSAERLAAEKPDFKAEYERQKNYIQEICSAAHKEGVAVQFWWGSGPANKFWTKGMPFNDNDMRLQLEDDLSLAGAGADLVYLETGGEFHCPDGFTGNYGAKEIEKEKDFNKWTEFFAKNIKDKFPGKPVEILCSGSGILARYVDIEGKAPFIDTLQTEIVVGRTPNPADIKYGVRYPLGVFGNDGRAVQHHFYYYSPHASFAAGEIALPLMFGLKSFCLESLSNKLNNPELVWITADYYRFMERTGLDKFAAKTAPFKFAGILRDGAAVKNDILKGRFKYMPAKISAHESDCKELSSLKNIPFDVIDNRFCRLPELGKYKLLVLPSDPVLSDDMAREIVKYVKDGGCLVTEGESVKNSVLAEALGLRAEKDAVRVSDGIKMKDGPSVSAKVTAPLEVSAVTARPAGCDSSGKPAVFINDFGKGKALYSPYYLSDNLLRDKDKAVFFKSLIKNLAGGFPWELPGNMENFAESSVLAADNGFVFAVYNPGQKPARFRAKINFPVKEGSFTLDIDKSARTKFDGGINVDAPPESVAFYIVGDEKATLIPAVKKLPNAGATVTGMRFLGGKEPFKYSPPKKDKKILGVFKPGGEKGGKVGSQNYGAEGIYDCLTKADLKDMEVKYLDDLKETTLNGCNTVIVPNMGLQLPVNLDENWYKNIRAFAEAGGGVMLVHHSMGISVAPPVFPEIGSWDGTHQPVKTMTVAGQHPVTQGFKDGDIFQSPAWDFHGIQTGDDGIVLAKGCDGGKLLSPSLVAGKAGQGKVIVSGIAIGADCKKENGKLVRLECPPEDGLKQILLNAVRWVLSK